MGKEFWRGSVRKYKARSGLTAFILMIIISSMLRTNRVDLKHETSNIRPRSTTTDHDYGNNSNNNNNTASRVVVVVVAIPNGYSGLAAESHRAYCRRHNYRLVVQREWRGHAARPAPRKAVRIQKLLGCTHVRPGEEYVLVIDTDVVIAPWAPPIHAHYDTTSKVGIVDEDQPTQEIYQRVLRHRSGQESVASASDYYAQYGYQYTGEHGILNGGVVFFKVNTNINNTRSSTGNCEWMQNVYYNKWTQDFVSVTRGHYDQPVLGVALLRDNRYRRMHHGWNRLWAYYSFSHHVGGPEYDLWDTFRASYMMHFCWKKNDIKRLESLMKANNVTF